MAENIREIVLNTLLELERGGQYSNLLVRSVLDKYDYLNVKDKAFFKRVTEGTVERQLELDYYLDSFSSVPVKKMKPLIRCLLRMSVYQLIYMETVPDSAVCNEACKLAEARKFKNLKGFVNGVLRSISRNKKSLPLPDRRKVPVKYLSVIYSMPEWLVKLWLREYGEEMTERILGGLLEIHPVTIRFSGKAEQRVQSEICAAIKEAGVAVKPVKYLPGIYTLEHLDTLHSLPGFEDGIWTVQDVSSALAVKAADIREGDLVLDACGAPGGKSLLAAESAGRVISRDVSEEKVEKIRENAERMHIRNITLQEWDATCFDEAMEKKADVVLLDVPCSGLGILGKKRDIKYHVSPEGLRSLSELQKKIVQTCSRYVKPGGMMVYSTCTIHRAENEDMVRFIVRELKFEPLSLEKVLPKVLLEEKRVIGKLLEHSGGKHTAGLTPEEQDACIQLLPGYMETDGFFIARFRRPEEI
ncbi:MAG: 16S rRNA (cytosine(967)-C(5))-methyltransferase RsmB [Acetatifactor sp.]